MYNHSALLAKQNRARRIGKADADFLLQRASEDLVERLSVTNRKFTDCLELLPLHENALLENWARSCTANLRQLNWSDISDETSLPLEDDSLDLVVSIFSLHWMNALPEVLTQILRALRPDGLFLAVIPGEDTLSELRETLFTAESEISGGAAPRVDPFASIRSLGSLLQGAGFALPVVDQDRVVVRYPSLEGLIADLRAMGCTSSLEKNSKAMPRTLAPLAARLYKERFCDDDGRLRATFNMTHLSGWKPHESQQKPLKPGSARISLKDVL